MSKSCDSSNGSSDCNHGNHGVLLWHEFVDYRPTKKVKKMKTSDKDLCDNISKIFHSVSQPLLNDFFQLPRVRFV